MLNEEELRDAALLVFANKQDQPGAKGAGEISEALKLGELRDRNWSIVACSAIDGKGINEGMDWLVVCSLERNMTVSQVLTLHSPSANNPGRERMKKPCRTIDFELDIPCPSSSPRDSGAILAFGVLCHFFLFGSPRLAESLSYIATCCVCLTAVKIIV